MTDLEAKRLHSGDEVYWVDPDGECSTYLNIQWIEFVGDGIIRIGEPSGAVVECFASELR